MLSPSPSRSSEEEEEEAVELEAGGEVDGEPVSEIKTADHRRARECADDIAAAAVEVTTPSDAIDVLTKAIPDDWPPQARDIIVAKLQSPRLRFFPAYLPSITLHPSSTTMDDALWAFVVDEVVRVPPSRASCNLYSADMIVEVLGIDWLICGFILLHATSADKVNLLVLQDLTKQPATVDWIVVLFNSRAGGKVASEVPIPQCTRLTFATP